MSEKSFDSSSEVEGEDVVSGQRDEGNRSPSLDSATVNDIDDFIGAMENELEEILQSQAQFPAPTAPYQPQYFSIGEVPREYPADDGWTLYYSPEGYPYYFNSVTQESAWAPVESATTTADRAENQRRTPTDDVLTEDGVLESLEGVNPSPTKQPIDSVRNIESHEEESKQLLQDQDRKTPQSNSLLKTATGSLSSATATATTYGKSLLAVAANTATTFLKPTSSSATTPSSDNQQNNVDAYQTFLRNAEAIEITIAPRSATKVPFILKKGHSFLCRVQVKDYDLGVALRERKMTDAGCIEVDLHPLTRYASGASHNLSDPSSLRNVADSANNVQSTRHIILVLDNSYSTFRSKSCIYHILQLESSSINSLLDIPETVQFNEFFDEDSITAGASAGGESELDNSTLTEQSESEDEREEGSGERERRPLHRVELIPLSVATNQKMKPSDRVAAAGGKGNEFHVSDFHSDQDEPDEKLETEEEPQEKEEQWQQSHEEDGKEDSERVES